ncbi:MAG: hypothetical protein JSS10_01640 [Verrucomicrobia bacterium]|nr:hypothetical protein [Verrucomicrobiota bacterium]
MTANFQAEPKIEDIANFKHDNRRLVGHFKKLKIGGEELKADFNLVDPMDPANRVPLCGMVTFLEWDTKPGGLLTVEGRLSAKNQGIYNDVVNAHDKTAECEFELDVYRYDDETEKYYKCFHTDGKAIEARLSEERRSIAHDEVESDYRQIRNHKFELYIIGSDKKDELLHIAYSADRKKAFKFGQKAKA